MINVNKFFLVLTTFLLFSCEKQHQYLKKDDNEARQIYYLDISDNDQYDQMEDDDWKETLKITKSVFVGDSCFGDLGTLPDAIKFVRKNNIGSSSDCYIKTAISIKDKKKNFIDCWVLKQNFLWEDGSFGEYAGTIDLDECYIKKRGEILNGLKIIYKLNNDNNYRLYFLNFVQRNNEWKLASREIITANMNDNSSTPAYCFDTINLNFVRLKNKEIFISDEMLFNLNNPNCK